MMKALTVVVMALLLARILQAVRLIRRHPWRKKLGCAVHCATDTAVIFGNAGQEPA